MSNDGGFGYGPPSSQQLEDGNLTNSSSMVPQSKPFTAWAHMITPAVHATASAPNHVYIGSIVGADDNHSPIKLDINPVKWRKVGAGETAAAGDIIFVYRRIG